MSSRRKPVPKQHVLEALAQLNWSETNDSAMASINLALARAALIRALADVQELEQKVQK